jgi:hypothetical protein
MIQLISRTRALPLRAGLNWLLPALFMLFLGSTAAFAQIGTSTVRGTVTDEQGAAIGGATVTLVNPTTNATRTQTTGADGSYSFSGIPVGVYNLKVEAANFKQALIETVRPPRTSAWRSVEPMKSLRSRATRRKPLSTVRTPPSETPFRSGRSSNCRWPPATSAVCSTSSRA